MAPLSPVLWALRLLLMRHPLGLKPPSHRESHDGTRDALRVDMPIDPLLQLAGIFTSILLALAVLASALFRQNQTVLSPLPALGTVRS